MPTSLVLLHRGLIQGPRKESKREKVNIYSISLIFVLYNNTIPIQATILPSRLVLNTLNLLVGGNSAGSEKKKNCSLTGLFSLRVDGSGSVVADYLTNKIMPSIVVSTGSKR